MSQGTGTTSAAPSHDEADSGPQQALFDLIRTGRSFSGREKNCCFLNLRKTSESGRHFADVSAVSGVDFSDDGRGLSLVDWDFDGDIDLWVANRNGPQARFLRNDSNATNHHLGLRLRGTASNRDAIGARVEVWLTESETAPLVKTLRAGDGYLSQSSKQLVFGLGKAKEIDHVVVRWPGKAAEKFDDLSVDKIFELVQGTGTAQLWTPPTRTKTLTSSRIKPPSESGRVETILSARVPLPKMQYESLQGKTTALRTHFGKPFLLNLWASWCAPCVAELKEFTERAKELRKAGLGVVALSLDTLGTESSTAPAGTRALLEKIAFTEVTNFAAGHANARLLDKLQIVNDRIFSLRLPLPVPTSFLVDSSGRVAAVYKGAVAVDRLLKDVGTLGAKLETLRSASLPFEGRWHRPPNPLRTYNLIMDLIKKDFLIEAKDLTERSVGELLRDTDYPQLLARMGNEEYERGLVDESITRYREALKLDPKLASAHLNLAVALWQKQEVSNALESYRAAVRYDPRSLKAHQELATRLAQLGKRQEALGSFEEAVKLAPRNGELRANYGLLLLQLGRRAAALEQLRNAVRFEPDDARVRLNLGLALIQDDPETAIQEFREALRIDSTLDAAYFQLARLLATHPDAHIRDGDAALIYAKTLAHRTGLKEPQALNLLAIAYAEAGLFTDAVETAEKAERLALDGGQESLATEVRRCLKFYRAGQVCGRR